MRRLTLPDGLEVFSLNADETRFIHDEVFGARCYLQHGIELRDGDCVFDVGANIGMASIFFAKERRVRVFAFEPSPQAYGCLKANIELYHADARLFECGLSRESGTAEFTFYPGNSVMSGFHADLEQDRAATKTFMVNSGFEPRYAELFLGSKFRKETFPCRLRTISEIVDEEQVARIDLLKVDVEKSEREVLAGIRQEHWGLIRQAVVEVHDEHGALHQVKDTLTSHGFRVTVEQNPRLKGTAIVNLFAIRSH
ncbi:MAG TPA: FkbM family methyltransferase [Bryobacteraceae bacterium]|nr:FkbM family methyltransferase [Bryobacteraceae bacterium]